MPAQLFVSVQVDFPWELGPAGGRYLLRSAPDADPERVLVIQGPARGGAPQTRITLIDPLPLAAQHQAEAWLADAQRDPARICADALALVNRILYLHRLVSADPALRVLAREDASAIRVGWGSGEQLADGRLAHASELPREDPPKREGPLKRFSRRARLSGIAEQERLAALLGGRLHALACEELALRARADLDAGRLALAAIELQSALAAAVTELRGEHPEELALRVDELESLRKSVGAQAQAALEPKSAAPEASRETLQAEPLAHALSRLESALRARAAAGVRQA